jgi:hypothetical protein
MTITHITPREQELINRVAELEKDAARYRHLVKTCNIDYEPSEPWQLVIWEPNTGEDWKAKLDAAIDDAMVK